MAFIRGIKGYAKNIHFINYLSQTMIFKTSTYFPYRFGRPNGRGFLVYFTNDEKGRYNYSGDFIKGRTNLKRIFFQTIQKNFYKNYR